MEDEVYPTLGNSIESTQLLKIGPSLSKSVDRTLGNNDWANQCNDDTGQRLFPSSRQPRRTKFVQPWFSKLYFCKLTHDEDFISTENQKTFSTASFKELFFTVNHKNELLSRFPITRSSSIGELSASSARGIPSISYLLLRAFMRIT